MTAIAALAATETLPAGMISVAHPVPVALRDLMTAFAAREGRHCHFVLFPGSRSTARGGPRSSSVCPPFRADSLLGLVHRPLGDRREPIDAMGVDLHGFGRAR